MKRVDPFSCCSLLLQPRFEQTDLARATGFCTARNGKNYLITNWHVVTGRHPDTDECIDRKYAAIPNKLAVYFHAKGNLGQWVEVVFDLQDKGGENIWIEHPSGRQVDVVAIQIPDLAGIDIYTIDKLVNPDRVITMPALSVCVIGYPLGLTASGNWPIWKTGHIATDPDLDFQEKPIMLIDATTRGGMSGSPVVVRGTTNFITADGMHVALGTDPVTNFVGVYSGRTSEESELGRVWKPSVIDEIISTKSLGGINWKQSFQHLAS